MAKKPPANPVTQQGRDCFQMFIRKWQSELNLHDWRIEQSSRPAAKANMAEVDKFDLKARLATYRIGADFGGTPVTDMSIEEIACHEALHIFLYELIEAARESSDALDSIEHAKIHTLVRLLVPMPDPEFVVGKKA